jgi:ketosteroid isomerase-like protein
MKTARARGRTRLFPTADEAQIAFYDAFERGDIAAMMAVWAESDDIVCVHPGGARLVGFEAVRESWARIFLAATQLRVRTLDEQRFAGQSVAVLSVIEEVLPRGQQGPANQVYATNVFELTEGGWRMVVHHATSAPEASAPEEPAAPTHTLH